MTHKAPLISDLKTRRQALGWSTTDVSERCGIKEQSVADWERGMGSPQLEAIEQWAEALGLKVTLAPVANGAGQGLRVDWSNRQITVDGAPTRLTPMEWKALERLAWAPGELVTHQDLFRHLYGSDRHYRAQSTAVRVLITKLRRLLPLRIEAQWRRGYVVNGLEPSLPRPPVDDGPGDGCGKPPLMAEKPSCDSAPFAAKGLVRPAVVTRSERLEVVEPPMRRFPAPAPQLGLCRDEELGVIERFLAERGATRCPDVATIQHQPLPTLVWDKIKRKWVRPQLTGREAS